MPQSDTFVGPFAATPERIQTIKNYLDFTYSGSGAGESVIADDESAYHLGANHAFWDTLDVLQNGFEGEEDIPKVKDHTKRNLVIAFVAGGVIGSWVERKRIDRAFKRMGARIKTKLHEQTGWVDYTTGGK